MSEINKSFPFQVKDVDETQLKQLKDYYDGKRKTKQKAYANPCKNGLQITLSENLTVSSHSYSYWPS